jgi:ribonucleoside-diphosphate reductase alpha chain
MIMAQMASISQQIWDMKYRLKQPDGTPVDRKSPDERRALRSASHEEEGRAGG